MLTEVFDTGPLHAWVVLDLPDAQKGGRLRSASTAVLRGRPRGSAPHDAHKRCRPGAYLAPQALSATTSAPGRRCSQARTAGSRAVLLPEPTAIPGNPRQSTGIGRGERRDAARLEVPVLQATSSQATGGSLRASHASGPWFETRRAHAERRLLSDCSEADSGPSDGLRWPWRTVLSVSWTQGDAAGNGRYGSRTPRSALP